MKYFLILLLGVVICACAFAEDMESPTLRSLYFTDNELVTIYLLEDKPDVEINIEEIFSVVLNAPEIFDPPITDKVILDECFFIECAEEVNEKVLFGLPVILNPELPVLNVFVYYNEEGTRNTYTIFGEVTEDGNEIVDLTSLPANTLITMYVLHIIKE